MNYYNEIKEQIINNEITKRVKDYSKNKSDLTTYYNVGKLLSEAGKHYGEGIIKEYSVKLTEELGKGYTESNLKRFRQFYQCIEKGATVWHQLTWSHYKLLITLNTINKINYYSKKSVERRYSVRDLQEIIKSKEYERLDESVKFKLINAEQLEITDLIPNPIHIKNKNNYKEISEKVLQTIILEDLENFMNSLGNSFSFIGSEYKIKLGDTYNYIDLLLFNYEYNCFVVIELKVTELKKEHLGQIEVYMNYIDSNKKKQFHNKTIGIIICKKDNQYLIEYCSDKIIISKEYIII